MEPWRGYDLIILDRVTLNRQSILFRGNDDKSAGFPRSRE
jgi:hypothetical protein